MYTLVISSYWYIMHIVLLLLGVKPSILIFMFVWRFHNSQMVRYCHYQCGCRLYYHCNLEPALLQHLIILGPNTII